MKKNLLSVLAGLTVISSALALPSPEDRRTLCEKHPDKYVWVEKTQACVPIHPCSSDNFNIINAYCDTTFNTTDMSDSVKARKLIQKYLGTENVTIKTAKIQMVDEKNVDALMVSYDGWYKEFPHSTYGNVTTDSSGFLYKQLYTPAALSCHLFDGLIDVESTDSETVCYNLNSVNTCKELVTFVESLEGKHVEYRWENSRCVIVLPWRVVTQL